jgi:hypothetical protein
MPKQMPLNLYNRQATANITLLDTGYRISEALAPHCRLRRHEGPVDSGERENAEETGPHHPPSFLDTLDILYTPRPRRQVSQALVFLWCRMTAQVK